MEDWARVWLENQRKAGERCLEIKVRDLCHYVYRSTTRYDRKLKKSRKVSEYLGKLDREHGFIPKGETPTTEVPAAPQSVKDYGNSMILHHLMAELKPLLRNNFPEQWGELYAMSIVRVNGYVPLRRVKDSWEELYDPEGLNPDLSPVNLSKALGEVGLNRLGQDAVLSYLRASDNRLISYLTTSLSRYLNVPQAENGSNDYRIQSPQIACKLLCELESDLSTMIKQTLNIASERSNEHNSVEEMLEIYKITLNSDKPHLHDAHLVFGHLFVTFLSSFAYLKLQNRIEEAGLSNEYAPLDVLQKFSKVKHVGFAEKWVITEVPVEVRGLDERLKLNIFQTEKGS